MVNLQLQNRTVPRLFSSQYDRTRVVNYDRKTFTGLATGDPNLNSPYIFMY